MAKPEKDELLRLVRMGFRLDCTDDFENIFSKSQSVIRTSKGCNHLELWRSLDEEGVFMTYSTWESDQALQAYRQSTTFRSIWSQTKSLFDARPEASSYTRVRLG